MSLKYIVQYSLIVTLAIGMWGCATTPKEAEDIGPIGKKFHDLTAKFNGYFNAKELYQETVEDINESYSDNYSRILPIYPHESLNDAKMIEEDMNTIHKKVVKVSAIHHVSKWVDDCYVLMGKSQYLKQDYESAEETFDFFLDQFNPKDPDSRNYAGDDPLGNPKERRKEAQKERKEAEKAREKEKKARAKARKEEQKRRKKARRQRNKNKGRRAKDLEKESQKRIEEAQEELVASTDDEEVPTLDDDEAFLRNAAKKEEIKKDEEFNPYKVGPLKHRPAYYEGMLWLAKTSIKREKTLQAKYFLDRIEKEGYASPEVLQEVYIARVDLYIQNKNYKQAIESIDAALPVVKDRKKKARLAFIKAQLLERTGQYAQVKEAYALVKKFNPSFEMELMCDINEIKSSWVNDEITSEKALKKLHNMSLSAKYADFVSNLHFAQAEIMMAEGRMDEALEKFAEAEKTSTAGNKAEIYYSLGQLYLQREEFLEAKESFDKALSMLPKSDDRYFDLKRLSNNLKPIADNLTKYQVLDSLLRLGQMTDKELQAYALDIVKSDREKMLAQQKSENAEKEGGAGQNTSSGASSFWAYNIAQVNRGRVNFTSEWGARVLRDNWRRSNAQDKADDQIYDIDQVDTQDDYDYSEDIERLIAGVPKTFEEKEQMREELKSTMFQLGTAYRNRLQDYTRSVETLEALVERFPRSERKDEAYYYLHLDYQDLGNTAEASHYRNKLINEFPESNFTKFILNPGSNEGLQTQDVQIEKHYSQTYDIFQQGKYMSVLARVKDAENKFGEDHRYQARYDLLSAMATGKTNGREAYMDGLRKVILKHDNTPEQIRANEMLRLLKGDQEAFGGAVGNEELQKFSSADDKLHYIIVLLYDASGNDVNAAKKQINAFNDESYANWRLRTTSMYLNQKNKTHLILVRRFQNKDKAMNYYDFAHKDINKFLNTNTYSYDVFAVNQKNYRQVIADKSANAYRIYFDKYYLQSTNER